MDPGFFFFFRTLRKDVFEHFCYFLIDCATFLMKNTLAFMLMYHSFDPDFKKIIQMINIGLEDCAASLYFPEFSDHLC